MSGHVLSAESTDVFGNHLTPRRKGAKFFVDILDVLGVGRTARNRGIGDLDRIYRIIRILEYIIP